MLALPIKPVKSASREHLWPGRPLGQASVAGSLRNVLELTSRGIPGNFRTLGFHDGPQLDFAGSDPVFDLHGRLPWPQATCQSDGAAGHATAGRHLATGRYSDSKAAWGYCHGRVFQGLLYPRVATNHHANVNVDVQPHNNAHPEDRRARGDLSGEFRYRRFDGISPRTKIPVFAHEMADRQAPRGKPD